MTKKGAGWEKTVGGPHPPPHPDRLLPKSSSIGGRGSREWGKKTWLAPHGGCGSSALAALLGGSQRGPKKAAGLDPTAPPPPEEVCGVPSASGRSPGSKASGSSGPGALEWVGARPARSASQAAGGRAFPEWWVGGTVVKNVFTGCEFQLPPPQATLAIRTRGLESGFVWPGFIGLVGGRAAKLR